MDSPIDSPMNTVPSKRTASMPLPLSLSLSLSLLLLLSMTSSSHASAFDPIVAMAANHESMESVPILRQSSSASAVVVGEPVSIAVPRVDPRCTEVDPGPGSVCDTSLYANLMCNVRHIWSGCTEDTMACLPVESCTCSGIGSGRWECWSMASSMTCPDPSTVPERRGQRCDPAPPEPPAPVAENSRLEEATCEDLDPFPGRSCDVNNMECDTGYAWLGCTEAALKCVTTESCSCRNGSWRCLAMAYQFCEDPPEKHGSPCTKSDQVVIENSNVQVEAEEATCEDLDPFPGRSCDVDEMECGTRYAWLGCTEAALKCVTTESCSCRNGSWRCLAMASQFCEDPSTTPEKRGSPCTESDLVVIENSNVQVEADELQEPLEINPPPPSSSNPIRFYGLNYNTRKGPDWAADRERCKTRAEVVRDLRLLSRITSRIRILSMVDCNQGELVWSVLSDELSDAAMEVWLGLWVGPEEQVFVDEYDALAGILPDILNSDGWRSRLTGISVGSEAIYRKDVTIEVAIENLGSTKNLLSAFGMGDVPVAIVDIAPIYSGSQELRLASDVIMTNTFPFWEGLPIELATEELEIDLGWLIGLPESSGKPFVLSEHGWPSGGYLDGVGVASAENQRAYLEDSFCYLRRKGWPNYFFTAIDNDWRQEQDPENTIEGNWGFLTADLRLKDHFSNMEFTCDDGTSYSFASIDWSVPELTPDAPVDSALAACGLWQGCEALAGDCCPTSGGDYLGCCRDELFLGLNAFQDAPTDSPTESAVVTVPVAQTAPPTEFPTRSPRTRAPQTADPTGSPVADPTQNPTRSPRTRAPQTAAPTGPPVADPTQSPTKTPTRAPTRPPTRAPTTSAPTGSPTKTIEDLATTADEIDAEASSGVFPPWADEGNATEAVFVPKPEEDTGDVSSSSNGALADESSGRHHLGWSVTLLVGSCLLSLGLACLA